VTDVDGDVDIFSLDIDIDPDLIPNAHFSLNSSEIKVGDFIQFWDQTTGGNLPLQYHWEFGDGSQNSTEENPIHQFMISGTIAVKLTVTDINGNISSHIQNILVIQNNIPTAYFVLNTTIVYAGQPVQFLDGSYGGDGSLTNEWDFDDGSYISTEKNPIHIFELPGNYTVSLTIYDEDGDSDTILSVIQVLQRDLPTDEGDPPSKNNIAIILITTMLSLGCLGIIIKLKTNTSHKLD
jgi:PKD repeat protein